MATLTITAHAARRMVESNITVPVLRDVLAGGDTIERYPEDTPYPSRLMLGWHDRRPVHVVVADNQAEDEMIVITVYEPDLTRWEPGFRERRRA